ncbi:hypothetical protein RPMA_02365 [Tardiphaga alba]|uniref:Uncharacterized protein n=1 Tax=Tardiphaga alba TaxID=340268 RepID=A0ABX8AIJ0_9BRAD|nr:hypothetical protein RPMA_02365 [Tardiphaga alba]
MVERRTQASGDLIVARRLLTRPWRPEEVERLVELGKAGATVLRAAVALKRSPSSVRKKALAIGAPLLGTRAVRAALREAGD